MKPMALRELEGRKHDMTRARQSGQDVVAEVQRKALTLLEGSVAVRDWGEMRKSEEFYARFVREFEGVPFLFAPDFASLGLACDSLERYHRTMDAWRECTDDEMRLTLMGAAQKEAKTFAQLAGKLGLDPASRDKFMLNASLREALKDKDDFAWDE